MSEYYTSGIRLVITEKEVLKGMRLHQWYSAPYKWGLMPIKIQGKLVRN